ncbi:AAA family ATPase [Vagococcus xieshaowenii]|uniref:Chromosome segregation protein SMC n=1 Tax=Vagococcus xieshaowenii TaxID=2562451 RepID=A0AAJ5EFC5_9ENTE|nr:AAA family ATPase [Vagococcus xieshaowenii]QCA28229.1 chromosome segregation protein SMC [Vagococcus xieshaowenii]TFZ41884.1 chromosome segregation protein SMC [Vagococcus xieshaowenii]
MTMKINKLEIENVKRVKAVIIEPNEIGLTIIGGPNAQGKTSVLDSIAWALGGNKYKPSQAHREGSVTPPNLKITMNNGLIVERSGKNSTLKVTDPSGKKAGQQLLNSFVEELAIDLPKFMESTSKEKATTLLQIIGVGDQLIQLEQQEQAIYNERHFIGQVADQKEKFVKEMPEYPEAPKELVSMSDLILQQQEILAKNGENQRKREQVTQIEFKYQQEVQQLEVLNQQLLDIQTKIQEVTNQHNLTSNDLATAKKSALDLVDESTEAIEKNISDIEEINRQVRTNLDKEKAEEDAKEQRAKYNELSEKITEIRVKKTKLLNDAKLPLPGLSVEDGELTYNGQRWDNMSGAEQLRVSAAIVRQLKPECGFILMDKLEQMDMNSLSEFGQWLEQEGLQAIATRVSTGEECSIIIEDGYVAKTNEDTQQIASETPAVTATPTNTWEGAAF